MALWGSADKIFSPGTVTVNYSQKTVTGAGTSFTAATVGSVISIGTGNTFGDAVISGITSDRLVSIATTQYLSGQAITSCTYSISQKPVYTLEDSNYSIPSAPAKTGIYGIDVNEATVAVGTKYAVSHSGWVGIKTYVDGDGNYRVKSETLVAFSGISTDTPTYSAPGDADDDAFYLP